MKINTAQFGKDKNGWKITIPVAVTVDGVEVAPGVEQFGNDRADEAASRFAAITAAYAAAAASAQMASSGPRIEILSLDGTPCEGFATVKATDKVVYRQKADPKKNRHADTDVTERDLCAASGYVLVSRNGAGTVQASWGNPPDFGRYSPISPAGLAALRRLIVG